MGVSHFCIFCKQCTNCPLFWSIFLKYVYIINSLEDIVVLQSKWQVFLLHFVSKNQALYVPNSSPVMQHIALSISPTVTGA